MPGWGGVVREGHSEEVAFELRLGGAGKTERDWGGGRERERTWAGQGRARWLQKFTLAVFRSSNFVRGALENFLSFRLKVWTRLRGSHQAWVKQPGTGKDPCLRP